MQEPLHISITLSLIALRHNHYMVAGNKQLGVYVTFHFEARRHIFELIHTHRYLSSSILRFTNLPANALNIAYKWNIHTHTFPHTYTLSRWEA